MMRIAGDDGAGPAAVRDVIRDGGVVCFPTDTTYGLAVDPNNAAAVQRLLHIKGRGEGKPILLLVDSLEMTDAVAQPPPEFESLAAGFWPGPITFVVPARSCVSGRITAGTGTVGVRWPGADIPLRLVSACGHPLTATSANRSGRPAARTADEAVDQLGDDLDAVVDAGRLPGAAASTVLDLTANPPALLREGRVPYRDLARFLGGRIRRRPE